MIITMSGKNGSGKGTVSKLLAEKLGYEYISIGNMKRELATAMGMTISEFNKEWEKPENKEKFDLKYEYYQKGLNVNSKIILDSRLWFYCQPDAFKVYLNVTDEEAAKRIFNDKDRKGDAYASLQAVQEATEKRNIDDAKRYKELYNIDITDVKNFDLVVDTTWKTPQQVAEEIIEKFNQFKKRLKDYED